MGNDYTQINFIKSLYGELDAIEYLELLLLMEENPEMKKMCEGFESSKEFLPKIRMSPSSKSINLILGYNAL